MRLGRKKHEEENDKHSKEIESLKAQLSAAQKENEKLKGGMFGMSSPLIQDHHRYSCLVHNAEYHEFVAAGLLTGCQRRKCPGFKATC